MLIKVFILIIILYFFALLQSSFLPHFTVFGHTPDLIFISAIFLFIFLPAGRRVLPHFELIAAFSGGIFLDIFSNHFLGFYVTIMLGILFFIKFIIRRYVHIPIR